jgi:hypothetical protein
LAEIAGGGTESPENPIFRGAAPEQVCAFWLSVDPDGQGFDYMFRTVVGGGWREVAESRCEQ